MLRFSGLRTVLILGLAIRLLLAPFFAHPFDVWAWYLNGQNFLSGTQPITSFLVPYGYALLLFVIPASLAFGALSSYTGAYTIPISSLNPALNPGAQWQITVIPGLLFNLLVKLPLIASDSIIALLLYRLVMKHLKDERLAIAVSAMWFLNPLTIWVSSGWGTFDTLPALFTVLALYFVMEDKLAYSGVSLALAIAMKYYAVVLIPSLLVLAWRRSRERGVLLASGGLVFSGLALFLPLLNSVTSTFVSLANGPSPSGIHYSGLSFWSAITLFSTGLDQSLVSAIILVLALLGVYAWIVRAHSERGLASYSAYFALPIMMLLLAYRFVGENYFIWLLPFASFLALGSVGVRRLYWIMSLIALASSMVDSLLPYYMLPMAPWIGGYLAGVLSAAGPYRVASQGSLEQGLSIGKVLLSALGVSSAIVIMMTALKWVGISAVRGFLKLSWWKQD